MGKHCAVIPQVVNPQGENEDSKLYKDLLSFLPDNRNEVNRIYKITKNPEFIENWNPKLTLDKNGEPTVRSLLLKTNLSKYIPEDRVLKKLNKEIGFYKKGMDRPALWIANSENRKLLEAKARQFNQNSEFSDEYVARVTNIVDNESDRIFIGVRVEKRTKLYSAEAKQMEYNSQLNDKLRQLLAQHGVSVGVLNAIEERMRVNGVTDFSLAKTTAEGLVEMIRLADGIRGEKALPEEFAHFALEAMGNHPLSQRLINHIIQNDLASEIIGEDYQTYETLYEGDAVKLAKEAAGKLLAKHLLQQHSIPNKPYKSLLERLIAFIKNFFKQWSASDIQKAMLQADKDFGVLARDILSGHMDEAIDIKNISESTLFYNTTERVQRDKKLLQNIIKNELKRLKVYEARSHNSTFSTMQKLRITELEKQLENNNEIEGIYSFLENALSTLNKLDLRIRTIREDHTLKLNDKAKVLRDVRNYLYSYKHILADIKNALLDEEKLNDNRYGEKVRVVVDQTITLLDDLFKEYNKIGQPLFIEFIKPFIGEGIEVPFGKWKGRKITAESIIEFAEEDISFFDRWLDSMADSSSYILKVMDQAVKQSKENARLDTIELEKQLKAAGTKLEQAGIKTTSWMFERDSGGNLTGQYISEINHALFREKMRDMYKSLNKKYGENPVGEDSVKYATERSAWFSANMEIVNGVRRPKLSLYKSQAFASLSPAQKDFYNTVMEIKEKLDSYLPDKATTLLSAVKIRKDLVERVKSSSGVSSGAKQIWENIKDQFIRRSDDIEFGDRITVKDFEGNQLHTLPIYYTSLRDGENMNDISTDVVSTLTAYAAMANDFNEMNKVIDILELSRDMLRDNLSIGEEKGDKPLMEKFSIMGKKVESRVLKTKDERRIIQRLNDFFEMQVYGRYMADEGTFGKTNIDKAKVANFVNRVTALNTLALNVLSGISNVATGKVMMRIESFSKEFFNEKNTIIADKNYAAAMPAFLGELGNRVKTSKLALWSELFNVPQEYESDVRQVNFDRKTWATRMNSSAIFFMNNAGEHWMQHRTSLALADRYKMKAPDGKIVSLWDAMEVAYIDPKNKKLGARLQVKKGYTKQDGTEFTRNDIIAFSRKVAAINQRMHGIYNKLDRNAIQRLSIGRMGMMFRKWIKPSLNRRFKSVQYNFDIKEWTEGYYRTLGRFLVQLCKELKEGQFAIAANWKNLHPTEKANIRRALTEIGHFLAIALVLGLIEWSDDKDRPWLIKMIEYQARRLYTELGALIPGPQMAKEGLRIVKSPAAGINTIEDTLGLIGIFNPYNYEFFGGEDAILDSGRYKGENRATRLFFESPIIPMNRTIYRGLHPEEGIPFFKQ